MASTKPMIHGLLQELQSDLEAPSRGLQLVEVAGGYQLRTAKINGDWVKKLLGGRPARMGRATLETLAIIAYRQPITKAEIEAIRGVDVDGVITTLLERNLIRAVARKDVPGRPFLYGTTAGVLTVVQSQRPDRSADPQRDGRNLPAGDIPRRRSRSNRPKKVKRYTEMERLQKIIARAGLASRREAERWIVEGRITVNGTVVDKLGSQADPFKDSIKIDGKRVKSAAEPLYYALHKPPGVITTLNDPQHRPDITPYVARLGEKKRLFPVGRLDYNTTGLLLLTNDGDLAMRIAHPRYRHSKALSGEVERLSD